MNLPAIFRDGIGNRYTQTYLVNSAFGSTTSMLYNIIQKTGKLGPETSKMLYYSPFKSRNKMRCCRLNKTYTCCKSESDATKSLNIETKRNERGSNSRPRDLQSHALPLRHHSDMRFKLET